MTERVETNSSDKFTVKEIVMRIDAKVDMLAAQMNQKADVIQVAAIDSRLDSIERDMQEGKETVKSMLLPDYHAHKQQSDEFRREVHQRLDSIERDPIWVTRSTSRPRFEQLIRQVEALEQNTVTQDAVTRYKKWLLVTAVPAILGAAWAAYRLIESLVNGNGVP